ncbi:hypothetical protein DMC64_27910 [Amycolatopsis sp. WAC 04197]|uniref:hypothetical protein n=1 Tax=Amycolatopsis sp. WAC 04197 TaxID=2203199 RepID=UPI000F7B3566|nr:hypothetical protein [Amycolatopsis sp. WAC 04197]RSN41927.1 hypothetical protein DMC64_27910 [Amycolatopsis sp. WAC 04197]
MRETSAKEAAMIDSNSVRSHTRSAYTSSANASFTAVRRIPCRISITPRNVVGTEARSSHL